MKSRIRLSGDKIIRTVRREIRVPTLSDLLEHIGLHSDKIEGLVRLRIPIAFQNSTVLEPTLTMTGSHEPSMLITHGESKEFTQRIASWLSKMENRDPTRFTKLQVDLRSLGTNTYIQFVEVDARLGDIVIVVYEVDLSKGGTARDAVGVSRDTNSCPLAAMKPAH